MIKLFALRHKASGLFMPRVKNRRGYSNWEPGKSVMGQAVKGSIRLFDDARSANLAIVQWAMGMRVWNPGAGDYDVYVNNKILDVGRKREDLEIVPFTLTQDAT